jgi:hypothetical protein
MNFIEAIKLVNSGKVVYRKGWGSGCQMSLNKDETNFIAYHVAACEIPIGIEDVLAEDWIEGRSYER